MFHFDAYGNQIGFPAGALPLTSYLYSGESFDQNIGQQYLRALVRPRTGRFNRLDPFAGNTSDPMSLHKYAGLRTWRSDSRSGSKWGVSDSIRIFFGPPDLTDSLIGGLVGLVSAYAARLEWAVEWLSDPNLSDELNPFADNLWVTEAMIAGAVQPWLEYFNDLFSYIHFGDDDGGVFTAGMRCGRSSRTRLPKTARHRPGGCDYSV